MTAISPDARRSLLAANLICLASMVVWAAGLPAADLIIPHMPPIALTAARTTLAALVLLPVWIAAEGIGTVTRANWVRGAWVGFVTLGLASFFVILALQFNDPVTVAIVSAAMPLVGILLECFADKRPFSRALALGLALSLIGGLIAVSGAEGKVDFGLGVLAALASVTLYAWGSRETVKALPDLSPLGRVTITLAGCAAVALIAALGDGLIRGNWPDWPAIGPAEFGGLAVFGIGSMAVSQLMWIIAVGRIGIGAASMHMNAVPFYVMLMVFVLGGPWNWAQTLGAIIVVTGALIAQGLIAPVLSARPR
ncbi:DMT family transporter [Rhodobacter calidifons]|uniref:DMT family transporter n=1 Tax=Rhodobacter calidifons TaxID=2715277 RepID=A0ABX0G8W1_9RHOB|nr:DMT family transporter [Rhodobacter calidifons]NHB77377.1 DMT family transporter [Rhodobacter calidifons]